MDNIDETLEESRTKRSGNNHPSSENYQSYNKHLLTAGISIEYTETPTYNFSDEELKSRNIIAGFAHDPRSEPYRQLRSQILQKMKRNYWTSLAITSPKSDSGSTLTALNLAISISQDVNQTVVLVDLNLSNPGIAKTLCFNEVNGSIVDYINDAKNKFVHLK